MEPGAEATAASAATAAQGALGNDEVSSAVTVTLKAVPVVTVAGAVTESEWLHLESGMRA